MLSAQRGSAVALQEKVAGSEEIDGLELENQKESETESYLLQLFEQRGSRPDFVEPAVSAAVPVLVGSDLNRVLVVTRRKLKLSLHVLDLEKLEFLSEHEVSHEVRCAAEPNAAC
jgi:hypothetical protein